tara:strand:+ start:573 stop:731 length:159 start_codon:yes stop_codon:yes gene_type:complete
MARPNYAADKAKYGASDKRIRDAGRDPAKLLDAARQHPDRASKRKEVNNVNA